MEARAWHCRTDPLGELGYALPAGWQRMSMAIVREFAPHFIEAASEDQLAACLAAVTSEIGFDHYAVSFEPLARKRRSTTALIHNYPRDWANLYVTFDLAGHDPVRRACGRSITGFEWQRIQHLIPMTLGDHRMLAAGIAVGVADGFTVPRHLPGDGSGSCSFVVGPQTAFPLETLQMAEILGGLAIAAARNLTGHSPMPPKPVLSDRQRECVLWTARGKTAADTATILGIKEMTVVRHLQDARERYNVSSSQLLILCTLFDGLISLADVFRWWNNPHI